MTPELLPEPLLEFGNDRLSEDPKQGIAIGSFFSTSSRTHRSEIHYAILGTNYNIEKAQEWIKQFENPIEASDIEVKMKGNRIEAGQVVDYDDEESLLFGADPVGEEEPDEEEESTSYKNKRLNPDFPGFNAESIFQCGFVNDAANNRSVKEAKIPP